MGNHPPKLISARRIRARKRMLTSAISLRVHFRVDALNQRMISGAMIKSPVTSPCHQVSQRGQKLLQEAKPPSARLVRPMLGLTNVLINAARENLKTLPTLLKASNPLAHRLTSHAPHIASRVLPAAIPSDVAIFPAVAKLTRNAPTKIAGHIRLPNKSNAAKAMPAGGQTGQA